MDPAEFRPIPTCDIPAQIVEREGRLDDDPEILPRILLQSAGRKAHSRRLLLITVAFALLSALEAVLLVRLQPSPLVVYQDPAVRALLEEFP